MYMHYQPLVCNWFRRLSMKWRCLTFADCRLQTDDRLQTTDYRLHTCVDSVTLTFAQRWLRKAYWGLIMSHLAYSRIFSQKMEMNIIMEDACKFTLMWISAWCIITACGVSAFTVDIQAILQRKSGFALNIFIPPCHIKWTFPYQVVSNVRNLNPKFPNRNVNVYSKTCKNRKWKNHLLLSLHFTCDGGKYRPTDTYAYHRLYYERTTGRGVRNYSVCHVKGFCWLTLQQIQWTWGCDKRYWFITM